MKMSDDREFGRFLCSMNYAEGSPSEWSSKVSTGLLVYMWEAWRAAKGRPLQGWKEENDRAAKG
jgi:hypothetical protein